MVLKPAGSPPDKAPADSGLPRKDDEVMSETPGSTVRVAGSPILRILVSFPIACFFGTLVTDIAYAVTADMMWADFSAWLLAAGMVMGVLAVIAGVIDLLANRRTRPQRQTWTLVIGSLLVLALALLNNLVHSRDAWTSVVPMGLAISALTVLVMMITAWLGTADRYGALVKQTGIRQ
jgi:uncharacterized membrane protein